MEYSKRVKLPGYGPRKEVANMLQTYSENLASQWRFVRTKSVIMDDYVELFVTNVTLSSDGIYVIQGHRVILQPPHVPELEPFSPNQKGEINVYRFSKDLLEEGILFVCAPEYFFPYVDNLKVVTYNWEADESNPELPFIENEEGEEWSDENVGKFVVIVRENKEQYAWVKNARGSTVTFQHVKKGETYIVPPQNQNGYNSEHTPLEVDLSKPEFVIVTPTLQYVIEGNTDVKVGDKAFPDFYL